ncbi:hypothetical protein FACS189446_7030 [Bacteroidia bacterium]|nr:hypothetical protein FACS189446_7030 [Bacteroidia bacterium]
MSQDIIVGNINILQNMALKQNHISELTVNVLKEFRNKGLGKNLMRLALLKIQECGDIEKIFLQVFSQNIKAINLYKQFGFVQEGVLSNHIKMNNGCCQDIIIMSLFVKNIKKSMINERIC